MFTPRTVGINREIIFGDQNHFSCQAVNLVISAVKLGILVCLWGQTRFWRQPQGSIRVAVFQPWRLLPLIFCLDGSPIVRHVLTFIMFKIKLKKLLSILLPMESWNYALVQHEEVMHLAMSGRNKQALPWVKEEATNVFRAAFQT